MRLFLTGGTGYIGSAAAGITAGFADSARYARRAA